MAVASDNFFDHIDDFFNYRQDIYEISPQTVKSNRVDLNLKILSAHRTCKPSMGLR